MMKTPLVHAVLLAASPVFAAPPAAPSPDQIRPILIGRIVPDAALRDLKGKPVSLEKTLAGKLTVLVFYRGGWCPYCNTHLGALGESKARLAELGWDIVAVSPDRPEELAKSKGKHALDYALLSDSKMEAARGLGLAFRVDSTTLEKYEKYGIDLAAASGETHFELPVPAVFLVGRAGEVLFSYVNPNYKIRLDSGMLIAAAEAYRGGSRK